MQELYPWNTNPTDFDEMTEIYRDWLYSPWSEWWWYISISLFLFRVMILIYFSHCYSAMGFQCLVSTLSYKFSSLQTLSHISSKINKMLKRFVDHKVPSGFLDGFTFIPPWINKLSFTTCIGNCVPQGDNGNLTIITHLNLDSRWKSDPLGSSLSFVVLEFIANSQELQANVYQYI